MLRRILTLTAIFLVALPSMVLAQGRSFIRDTEIEDTLRLYATPIFKAAGLDPNGVSVYIVSDNSLNAFVAGGQKLFINTGLLLKAETPEQVIGVMAHETGHITGGHLSRVHDQLRNASAISILSTIAGVAAGVAAGRSDVGTAAILGGQNIATRNFLAYSRTQESSADQAGVKYLTAAGISARGMMEFMETLEGQELLSTASQDPYMRSHPLTTERVEFLENYVANSALKDAKVSPELYEHHARMRAKLYAFTNHIQNTLRTYPESDTSVAGQYARAIAYYRNSELAPALEIIEKLIGIEPNNPYFEELKGQVLLEFGKAREAIDPLQKSVELSNGAPLIRLLLAHAMIETGDAAYLEPAKASLMGVLSRERGNASAWRFRAIVENRLGNEGEASLSQAEYSLLSGDRQAASYHAVQADRKLEKGTAAWLRAQDILQATNPDRDADKDAPK
ncbi:MULTISPECIES: M48 family metalloprotease [Thalassospira]|uniref:Peptidase n=2 Tax=Thalassospira TaxID=168934 RepID=A0A367W4C4_9PROT|nr:MULTISPECIES: M48 family metalloprotease [Thalassospira]MDG4721301.1 M48 family metalloprotease [Thalassospira sp. FZY0004]RCK33601.1 peptidase [Thalassospira profundimaris]